MPATKGFSSRGYSLTGRQINLFPSGTNFLNEAGRFRSEFIPYAMRGKNTEYSRYRIDPTTRRGTTSKAWITKKGGGGGNLSLGDFRTHLRIARYNVEKSAVNFAIILSLRAQKIFQESFKYKRFYSADGSAWPELTENTKKNRIRHGTWPGKGILNEFGDLYRSIKQTKTKKGGSVYTDPSEFKEHTYTVTRTVNGKKKKTTGKRYQRPCYAAVHNNGGELGLTYGNGFGGSRAAVKVKQRQFMGHSTYLFDFARQIARTYLFDDVFVMPKARK